MVKRFLIALVTFIAAYHLNAQSGTDKIEVINGFGGYKYQLNGINLKRAQLTEVIEKDPQAYAIMKKANENNTTATIIGAAGGLLIGIPIGILIANKEPRWSLAGVGAALALISFPFDHAYKKQTKAAVDAYNSNLTSFNRNKFKPTLSIGINNTGLGLLVKF